jgi:hypothetical protein
MPVSALALEASRAAADADAADFKKNLRFHISTETPSEIEIFIAYNITRGRPGSLRLPHPSTGQLERTSFDHLS